MVFLLSKSCLFWANSSSEITFTLQLFGAILNKCALAIYQISLYFQLVDTVFSSFYEEAGVFHARL